MTEQERSALMEAYVALKLCRKYIGRQPHGSKGFAAERTAYFAMRSIEEVIGGNI